MLSAWMLTACASGGTPFVATPSPPTEAMEPCPALALPLSGMRNALLEAHLHNMAIHHQCRARLHALRAYVCSSRPMTAGCLP